MPPQPKPCQDAVATRPDYDSFHEYRQLQSILNLQLVSSLLQPRNSGLPMPDPSFNLADAKMGVVFAKCGRGPNFFARYARN